jgi:hypothetical protein
VFVFVVKSVWRTAPREKPSGPAGGRIGRGKRRSVHRLALEAIVDERRDETVCADETGTLKRVEYDKLHQSNQSAEHNRVICLL